MTETGEQEAAVARSLLEWAQEHGLRVWWGQGKKDGSFFPLYDNKFGKHFLFSVWTYGSGRASIPTHEKPPFSETDKRQELAPAWRRSGVSIPDGSLNSASFELGMLTDKGCLASFLETFDWVLGEIKKAEATPVPAEPSFSPISDHESLA